MPAALAGLDCGTGGAKATIIGTDGRVLAHRLPLGRFAEWAAAALEGRALKVVFEEVPA